MDSLECCVLHSDKPEQRLLTEPYFKCRCGEPTNAIAAVSSVMFTLSSWENGVEPRFFFLFFQLIKTARYSLLN